MGSINSVNALVQSVHTQQLTPNGAAAADDPAPTTPANGVDTSQPAVDPATGTQPVDGQTTATPQTTGGGAPVNEDPNATYVWDDETRQAFTQLGVDASLIAEFEQSQPTLGEVAEVYEALYAEASAAAGAPQAQGGQPAGAANNASVDAASGASMNQLPRELGNAAWDDSWVQAYEDAHVSDALIQQFNLTGGNGLDAVQLQELLDEIVKTEDDQIDEIFADDPNYQELRTWISRREMVDVVAMQRLLYPEKSSEDFFRDMMMRRMEFESADEASSSNDPGFGIRNPFVLIPAMMANMMGNPRMASSAIPFMTIPGYGAAIWFDGEERPLNEPIYKDPRKLGLFGGPMIFGMGGMSAFWAWNGFAQAGTTFVKNPLQVGKNLNLVREAAAAVNAGVATEAQANIAKLAKSRGIDALTGWDKVKAFIPHTASSKAASSMHYFSALDDAVRAGQAAEVAGDAAAKVLSGTELRMAERARDMFLSGKANLNGNAYWMPGAMFRANHNNRGFFFAQGNPLYSWAMGSKLKPELTLGLGIKGKNSPAMITAAMTHYMPVEAGTELKKVMPLIENQITRTTPEYWKRHMRVMAEAAEQMGLDKPKGLLGNKTIARAVHYIRPTDTTDVMEAVRSLQLERKGVDPAKLYHQGGLLPSAKRGWATMTAPYKGLQATRPMAAKAVKYGLIGAGVVMYMKFLNPVITKGMGMDPTAQAEAQADEAARQLSLNAGGPDLVRGYVDWKANQNGGAAPTADELGIDFTTGQLTGEPTFLEGITPIAKPVADTQEPALSGASTTNSQIGETNQG